MELGSQNHSRDGLLGPNSIIVPYMDPLGSISELNCQYGLGKYPPHTGTLGPFRYFSPPCIAVSEATTILLTWVAWLPASMPGVSTHGSSWFLSPKPGFRV